MVARVTIEMRNCEFKLKGLVEKDWESGRKNE